MSRRAALGAIFAAAVTAGQLGAGPRLSVFAQAPPLFSARTELVVLHVVVQDGEGGYVTGLPAESFKVFENDRPQTISFFGEQDAPVTVGLLIDNSGSMSGLRDRVVAAAGAFVETSHPQDEVFALAFNEQVRAALPETAPFTGDAGVLRAALAGSLTARGRTALYDAVAAGRQYLAAGMHDTKVLVIVSDGGDNASQRTFEDTLRAAQTTDTLIYAVTLVDPLEPDAKPTDLKRLAEASGGEWFRPRDMVEAAAVLNHIARDIRNVYTVGYTPSETGRDSRFRRVRVTAGDPTRKRLRVRARQGYMVEDR